MAITGCQKMTPFHVTQGNKFQIFSLLVHLRIGYMVYSLEGSRTEDKILSPIDLVFLSQELLEDVKNAILSTLVVLIVFYTIFEEKLMAESESLLPGSTFFFL